MIDLGFAPPSNSYLTEEELNGPELYLPLRVKVCEECWLVQTEDFAQRDQLFSSNYAYFSSTSASWVDHAKVYSEMIAAELSLDADSFVVELASNDGYLLKNFVQMGIPCLGIEPTKETALYAESEGVATLQEFFEADLATQLQSDYRKADLIIANNVYAHVPDINDFTIGIKHLLATSGTVTLEFPHLQKLISECQFDTIYHEHYSYLSLKSVSRIFRSIGLRVFRVEKLATHGGSLRVFGCHEDDPRRVDDSVFEIIAEEDASRLEQSETYDDFEKRAITIRNDFIEFLIGKQRLGKTVMGYGAAAKGNTLLNYAGVRKDLLPAVFDSASSKQNLFLPGTHIPVLSPHHLSDLNPDSVVVLPWNIVDEITEVLRNMDTKKLEVWVGHPKLHRIS